jgi:hypothetical protein
MATRFACVAEDKLLGGLGEETRCGWMCQPDTLVALFKALHSSQIVSPLPYMMNLSPYDSYSSLEMWVITMPSDTLLCFDNLATVGAKRYGRRRPLSVLAPPWISKAILVGRAPADMMMSWRCFLCQSALYSVSLQNRGKQEDRLGRLPSRRNDDLCAGSESFWCLGATVLL